MTCRFGVIVSNEMEAEVDGDRVGSGVEGDYKTACGECLYGQRHDTACEPGFLAALGDGLGCDHFEPASSSVAPDTTEAAPALGHGRWCAGCYHATGPGECGAGLKGWKPTTTECAWREATQQAADYIEAECFTDTLAGVLEALPDSVNAKSVRDCLLLAKTALDVGRAATHHEDDAFRFAELALDLLKHGTRS